MNMRFNIEEESCIQTQTRYPGDRVNQTVSIAHAKKKRKWSSFNEQKVIPFTVRTTKNSERPNKKIRISNPFLPVKNIKRNQNGVISPIEVRLSKHIGHNGTRFMCKKGY